MFRKFLAAAGIGAVVILSGCIDATTVVKVNKDGSGVIVEAVYFGKAFQMMQQMGAQMGAQMAGQGAAPAAPAENKPFKPPLEIEKYKSKVATMGEGVTFVSAKEVTREDGSTGIQVVYKFADVSKIKIESEPEIDAKSGGEMPGAAPAAPAPKEKKNPITFQMTKGATPKLEIIMPKQEPVKAEAPASAPAGEAKPVPGQDAMQAAMMKQMFDGFRIRVAVAVDGKITKSNAAYQEKDSEGNSHIVTLLDMNIGKLLGDEATAKKLAAMGEIQDMAEAKEKLKGIDGLKIETSEKVEIEFE
jgi:hypothetical protein